MFYFWTPLYLTVMLTRITYINQSLLPPAFLHNVDGSVDGTWGSIQIPVPWL